MRSIETKRKQSSWMVLALGILGIIFGNSFSDIGSDTTIVWSAIMVLSMLTGIIGIMTD